MKREASPIVVAIGILALLVAIEIVYWQKLGPAKPRVTAATTQGGGGSRGGSRSEAPSGDPRFVVVTLAGAPEAGYRDGPAGEARFDGPVAVCADRSGNAYVADSRNHAVRRLSALGLVTTVAGGPSREGYADGPAQQARFSAPAGIALLPDGSLLIADTGNHRLRRITSAGRVSTFAGGDTLRDELGRPTGGYKDGPVAQAQFRYPVGLAAAGDDTVYVADAGNHCVRRVADGLVSTLATAEGKMDTPTSLSWVGGILYATDTASGCIWAGPATGSLSRLEWEVLRKLSAVPSGVAVVRGGILVADARSHGLYGFTYRSNLSPGSPLAGQQGTAGWADGRGDEARFSQPAGLGVGPEGSVYVADFGNNCLRKVTFPGRED
jgi:hypothetical protein